MSTTNLYDDVVALTHKSFGPAADRFVARQIRYHLRKDPDQLQPHELRRLASWIELALRTIYATDQTLVDDYMDDLHALTQHNGEKP